MTHRHHFQAGMAASTLVLVPALLFAAIARDTRPDDPPLSPHHDALVKADPGRGIRPDPKAVEDFTQTVIDATQVLCEEHIKKDFDQGELVALAVRGVYRGLGEDVPPAVAARLDRASDLKEAQLTRLLTDVRMSLGQRKDLEELRDIDLALAGIFTKLEPGYEHPPQRECRERPVCLFPPWPTGVGIELAKDHRSGLLRVVTPARDGPAHKAGVQSGDLISEITYKTRKDQEGPPKVLSGKAASVAAAYQAILGEAGTKITLTLLRDDVTKPRRITIERDGIREETVFGARRLADADWDYLLDRGNKIGYVRVTSLTRHTAEDVGAAVDGLRKQGLKGLVLDLRGSPGGLLTSARQIADQFIDDGLICTIVARDVKDAMMGKSEGGCLNFPMVCLIDRETRLASELIAACLQDHKRAVILGERSPGDTVLRYRRFLGEGELCFAGGVFLRPSGKHLARIMTGGKEDEDWGVRPDKGFAVKLSPQQRRQVSDQLHSLRIVPRSDRPLPEWVAAFKDRQLETALLHLRQQIRVK